MPFQKGTSGNPGGRPKKGDSMAEAIRAYDKKGQLRAIAAVWKKAEGGDAMAFATLARYGWPHEARPGFALQFGAGVVPIIIHEHVE